MPRILAHRRTKRIVFHIFDHVEPPCFAERSKDTQPSVAKKTSIPTLIALPL